MTCAVQGCGQPAGTACTLAGCPGRSFKFRRWGLSLPSPRQGETVLSPVSPTPVSVHLLHADGFTS